MPASWHWSDAPHTTGLPPVHAPAWQVSVCVHLSPSSHVEPFNLFGFEHCPVAGLHVPASWHWSDAPHTTGLVPVHTPAWQVSVCVHLSPSLHAEPFNLFGFEHWPVAGLHTPTSWQASDATQVTPTQRSSPPHSPPAHTSFTVAGLPSSHDTPSAFFGFEHAPVCGSHVPAR